MAISLATALRKRLRSDRRVALVGIGSHLRADDACGLLVSDRLTTRRFSFRKVKVFIGATAPENLTGEIKRFKPDHVVLIDAADFKTRPGTTRLIRPEEARGVCFCTHQIPLQILADYLIKSIGCCVTIIGIQAKTLTFGGPVTPSVARASDDLAKTLGSILGCRASSRR